MTDGRQKWERYIQHYINTENDSRIKYTREQVDFLFDARDRGLSWKSIVRIWNDELRWPEKTERALQHKYHEVKTFG